jgi:hypothetical protein
VKLDSLSVKIEAVQKETAAVTAKKDADRRAKEDRKREWQEKTDAFFHHENRFWSAGISAGTSVAAPWLIATGNVTLSFLPYTILEAGIDAGFIHGYSGAEAEQVFYYSLYPFGHISFFVPISDLRWYLGAGGGFMMAHYDDLTLNAAAFDATTGLFVGKRHHYVSISYTMRTPIENAFNNVFNHKLSAGYTYRF